MTKNNTIMQSILKDKENFLNEGKITLKDMQTLIMEGVAALDGVAYRSNTSKTTTLQKFIFNNQNYISYDDDNIFEKTPTLNINPHMFMMGDAVFKINPRMAFEFLEMHSSMLHSINDKDAVLAAYEDFYSNEVNTVFDNPLEYLHMEVLFDNPGNWPFGSLMRTYNNMYKTEILELPTENIKILFLIVPLKVSYRYYTKTIIPCYTTDMDNNLIEYDVTGSLRACGITSTDKFNIKYEMQHLSCTILWNSKTKSLKPMAVPKSNYERSLYLFDKLVQNQFIANNNLELVGRLIILSERLEGNDTSIVKNIVDLVEKFLTRRSARSSSVLSLSESSYFSFNKKHYADHPEVQAFTQVCVLIVFLFSKIAFDKKEHDFHLVYPILEHLLSFERIREFIVKDGEGSYYDTRMNKVNGFGPYLIIDILTDNTIDAAKLHRSFNTYMAAIARFPFGESTEIVDNIKGSIRHWDYRQLPMEIAAIANPLNDYLFSVGRRDYRKFQSKINYPTVLRYPMMSSKTFILDNETADVIFDKHSNYIQRLFYVVYHLSKSKVEDIIDFPNHKDSKSFMRSSYDSNLGGFKSLDVSELHGHTLSNLEIHNIDSENSGCFTKLLQGDVTPVVTRIRKVEDFIEGRSKGNLLRLFSSVKEKSFVHIDSFDGLNAEIIINPISPVIIDNYGIFDKDTTTLTFFDKKEITIPLKKCSESDKQASVNPKGDFFKTIINMIGDLLKLSDGGKANYEHIVKNMFRRSSREYSRRHELNSNTVKNRPVVLETFVLDSPFFEDIASPLTYSSEDIHEFVLFLIDTKALAMEKCIRLPLNYSDWKVYIACTSYNGRCNSLPLTPTLIEIPLSYIIRLLDENTLKEIRVYMEMLDGNTI